MPPPLIPPIGLRLARTARTAGQAFDRALSEAGGSAPTWQVLLLVRSEQWGTQAQMAEAMGITGATLTHHLNALEKRGLVRRWREEGNRRVQRAALTNDGEALFERLRVVAQGHHGGPPEPPPTPRPSACTRRSRRTASPASPSCWTACRRPWLPERELSVRWRGSYPGATVAVGGVEHLSWRPVRAATFLSCRREVAHLGE